MDSKTRKKQFNDRFDGVNIQLDEIKDEQKEQKVAITDLQQRMTAVEGVNIFSTRYDFDNAVKDIFTELSTEFRAETHERELRRKKVIISDIPTNVTTEHDKKYVVEFAEMIGVNILESDIKQTYRVKRQNDANRPFLNIEFYEEVNKHKLIAREAINALKGLPSSHKFHGYSVYPDRTQTERDDFRRLWEEKERKNSTLQANGVTNIKFIVSGLKVKQIKIKQDQTQPTS